MEKYEKALAVAGVALVFRQVQDNVYRMTISAVYGAEKETFAKIESFGTIGIM